MDVRQAIASRRSVRRYKPQTITDEQRNLVLDAARLAPSWKNQQPFFVVVVSNRDLLMQLGEACRMNPSKSAYLNADCFLALCEDSNIGTVYLDKDYGLVDATIAMQQAMLQATALGLGTCWIGAFDEQPVKELLRIPEHVRVVGLTPLGVPDENPDAKQRRPMEEMTFWQRWGETR